MLINQAERLVIAAIESVYLDGVDRLTEVYFDERQQTIWGSFEDRQKSLPFSISLLTGEIEY